MCIQYFSMIFEAVAGHSLYISVIDFIKKISLLGSSVLYCHFQFHFSLNGSLTSAEFAKFLTVGRTSSWCMCPSFDVDFFLLLTNLSFSQQGTFNYLFSMPYWVSLLGPFIFCAILGFPLKDLC